MNFEMLITVIVWVSMVLAVVSSIVLFIIIVRNQNRETEEEHHQRCRETRELRDLAEALGIYRDRALQNSEEEKR